MKRTSQSTQNDSSEASRPAADPAQLDLTPGVSVDRYQVLERVGKGGMGVVYGAYDPALDRKIALKLMRAGRSSDPERLLDEAKSQARFAHPNVVTVHDVGRFAGQVFIAMEFMPTSLRDWWQERPRSPREIVRMFVHAGEGLAAAHALGIVHRDFKPENVLISADGRPRVSDFGLAASEASATGSGYAVGTPDYMAPEQARGERVDARADQFSFCVSLYEALYGARPFPPERDPKSPVPLMPAQPPGSTVPPSVRRVLFKGLADDPNARFPSMVALLDALRDDPDERRRQRLFSLGVSGAIIALAAGTTWAFTRETAAEREARLCSERVEQRVESAWGPARQEQIRAAFGAGAVWPQVQRRLEGEMVQWRAASLAACRLRVAEPERQRFSSCLEERRKIIQSLSDVFSVADPRVTENALNTVLLEVQPATGCFARVPAHESVASGSEDDERTRSALARTRVMMTAGKYDEALEEAKALAQTAAQLRAPQAEAEARLFIGELGTKLHMIDADESVREAIVAAEKIGNDELRLRAWIAMVDWCTEHPRKLVEGRYAADIALALLERLGRPPLLEAAAYSAIGVLETKTGRNSLAVDHQRRALELRLANLPNASDHPLVTEARTNLGLALPPEEGLPLVAAELETSKRLFGAKHPEMARALHNLGMVRMGLEEYPAALELFQQALAVREQNRRENPHADLGRLGREYTSIAHVLYELKKPDAAAEYQEHGVDLMEEGNAEPYDQYRELKLLEDLYNELGRPQDAERIKKRRLKLDVEE